MGAWGYGLFQCDSDLDLVDEISYDLAEEEISIGCPEDPKHVVEKLNSGAFHQLLTDYNAIGWKHGIVLLGAATMRLGGHSSDKDMDVLRATLPKTPMTDEAKAQMSKGLDGYKNNGVEWDFGSKGLLETVMEGIESRGGGSSGGELYRIPGDFTGEDSILSSPGVFGFNVLQDWTKMVQPKPK